MTALAAARPDRLIGAGPLLKVCGATDRRSVDLLALAGVDLVGLWYGIAHGDHDLDGDRLVALATHLREHAGPEPVVVTFRSDVDDLVRALDRSTADWLQLHAYQHPRVVEAIKSRRPDAFVLKVLHVDGRDCVERRLIGAYERAGVDAFLFDRVDAGGRVGSTGQVIDVDAVESLADTTERPFLVAGGVSPDNRDRFAGLYGHPRFAGIDVDTSARDHRGTFDLRAVGRLVETWGTRAAPPSAARARRVAGASIGAPA